ncbi:MAG: histidine phosphatase family protein [Chitinophagaceae bacterium]|nr:histidine phosphatase family protein [Chitinophagaceae bacterium]
MKTLLIVRHAKSDWTYIDQKDIERSLNDRGLRDAPMMGQRLKGRGFMPDLILSSSAKRAAQTASLMAQELQYPIEKIRWEDKLYHALPDVIQSCIFGVENEVDTLIVVCHNPGITYFVNGLLGPFTDNIPTCGMAAFRFDTLKWEEYPTVKAKLLFFDFPKNGIS